MGRVSGPGGARILVCGSSDRRYAVSATSPNKKAGHLATSGLEKGTCKVDVDATKPMETRSAMPVARRRDCASVVISQVISTYASLPQLHVNRRTTPDYLHPAALPSPRR